MTDYKHNIREGKNQSGRNRPGLVGGERYQRGRKGLDGVGEAAK